MQPELIRTYDAHGTDGAILLNGENICAAIELSSKKNQTPISCIPEGRYELKKIQPAAWLAPAADECIRPAMDTSSCANDAIKELQGCILRFLN